MQRRAPIYDKAQDGHYNLISALHKSVRGSDPDAALYYLCRMLDAGEPPLYIARRVVRMAIEDIGLADPQALVIANAAKEAYDFLGSPEGELAIAEAVIYMATAPKSNASYAAFGAAMRAAKQGGSLLPPKHILNAPTKLMQSEGYGRGYAYDHDQEEAFSGQNYFPDALPRQQFYNPPERGFEREIASGWITGRSCGKSGAGNDYDIDAYCKRIGYDGPRQPTLAVLRELHRLQPQVIAFEISTRCSSARSSSMRPRLTPSSSKAGVADTASSRTCFSVMCCARLVQGQEATARVRWSVPPGVHTPRVACAADCRGGRRSYLVDVGFGGNVATARSA